MSDEHVAAAACEAFGATEHQFETFAGRDVALGNLTVTRILPVRGRRLVGPWCFLDRFGTPEPRLAAPDLTKFANPNPVS